ncbi:hypothetical protein [Cytophaga hutchinsonii]|nr:hypothetical protein [Cytophaga hutchinsonii]
MKFHFTACICLVFFMCSCMATMPGSKTFNYCYPNDSYTSDSVNVPYASIPDFIQTDSALKKHYSTQTIHLANATGTLTALLELAALKKQYTSTPSLETNVAILTKKQEIANRLIICRTEIAGIAAELDCEGERAEQLSDYMSAKQNKQVTKLTVASITLGALTAVSVVFIKLQKTSDAVAITGGTGSAALGLSALISSRKTEYLHPRNLLTDIWYKPAHSRYYPATIWYLLTHKEFSNNKQNPIINNICERWKEYNQLEEGATKKTARQIDLLFGSGGIYTAELLETRANMLNQLQAAIKLLDQDIQQLLYTVSR